MIHFVAFLWIFFKGGGSFSISTSYTMYVFLFCCVRSQCSDVELVLQLVCSLEYFQLIIWSCDLMGHFIVFMESLKVLLQFKVICISGLYVEAWYVGRLGDTCIWYNRPIAVSCSVSPLYIIVGLHIQILSVCHVLYHVYSTVKAAVNSVHAL